MRELILVLMVVCVIFGVGVHVSANPFSDVPTSHWAYSSLEKLTATGVIEGYNDVKFKGKKLLTRYEFAVAVGKLMAKIEDGHIAPIQADLAALEKLTIEFAEELATLGVKVNALEGDVDGLKGDIKKIVKEMKRIQISGEYEVQYNVFNFHAPGATSNNFTGHKLYLNFFTQLEKDITGYLSLRSWNVWDSLGGSTFGVEEAWIDVKNFFNIGELKVGRQPIILGHGLVLAAKLDAIKFTKHFERVDFTLFGFDKPAGLYPNGFQSLLNAPKDGLNSFGVNLGLNVFGSHNFNIYYLHESFDAFDPYGMQGDLAASLGMGANPYYVGATLDGRLFDTVDYFAEYVKFHPDVDNSVIGKLNDMDDGAAWMLGFDWDVSKDVNFVALYGEGDEEFVPSNIYAPMRKFDINGRWNGAGSQFNWFLNGDHNFAIDPHGSMSFQGVKDLYLKLSGNFSDKTSAFVSYEQVTDNDNSAVRTIATAAGTFDYDLFKVGVAHQFRPNTRFALTYSDLDYDDVVTDTANGWDRLVLEMNVKF